LLPYIGYEAASEVAKEAQANGISIKQVLLKRGLFSEKELSLLLRPEEMTKPGIPAARQMKERGRNPGPDAGGHTQ
jgi:aspartate ammonia-lyase